MIKEFLLKQAIKRGSKDLPKEQVAMLEKAIEKNPDLFTKIAKECASLFFVGDTTIYLDDEIYFARFDKFEKVTTTPATTTETTITLRSTATETEETTTDALTTSTTEDRELADEDLPDQRRLLMSAALVLPIAVFTVVLICT